METTNKDLIDAKKTGENLKSLLGEMSLTDAAEKFGVSISSLSYWVSGKKLPSLSHMAMMAKHFGCKIDDIVAVKENE